MPLAPKSEDATRDGIGSTDPSQAEALSVEVLGVGRTPPSTPKRDARVIAGRAKWLKPKDLK